MRSLIYIVFVLVGCAHSEPVSNIDSQLASRIEHASTHVACIPGHSTPVNCIDNMGLVWSACAWNTCGQDTVCRIEHQTSITTGSCGLPDWPPCVSKI